MAATSGSTLAPTYLLDFVPPAIAGGVLVLGNFDGVHRGHHALINAAIGRARSLGTRAVALTFEPHPRTFFRPESPLFRLTPFDAKVRVLSALGIDGIIVIPFDDRLASLSAEAFVGEIVVERLRAAAVVVGYNFHFGSGRSGSSAFLVDSGARFGFPVSVIGPVEDDAGLPFSATRIRAALEGGDIADANRMLGYRWFVLGEVRTGDRRGRELGFPTANIRLGADCRLRHGIYAVRVRRADGSMADGVASFGRRPTFDNGAPLLEVYLFDFDGSLYGEELMVSFVGWIRPEERFQSVEALVARMAVDCGEAAALLAEAGPGTALDLAVLGR
jgi:riboflavin kinase/FMN adenylyltransferase